jgi:hypothetical protein
LAGLVLALGEIPLGSFVARFVRVFGSNLIE